MKTKKGLKLLSIFLVICTITLYFPNNILIASAEQPQDPDSAEEETLYVDTEESESETDMMIIGGMTEIPSVGVSTNQNPSDIRVKVDVEGGSGFYLIPNGVYAFENVGNNGLWLDIQQDTVTLLVIFRPCQT